jgi:mRNA interferase MazF
MKPARGELWWIDFNPTRGREQTGMRPGLVVSADRFNRCPAGLAVVVPVTTRDRPLPFRVAIEPPEGGVKRRSFAICEGVRSVSTDRLTRRTGAVSDGTMDRVSERLRLLLDL